MRLGEVLDAAGLSAFGEIALLIFVAIFAGVAWRTFSPRRVSDHERASRLPFED